MAETDRSYRLNGAFALSFSIFSFETSVYLPAKSTRQHTQMEE